jgi:dynein heavy chain 2
LAQTQNPTVIQLHLKKLFAAIHTVGFSADNANIIELFSAEKERVTLTQKVQLTEFVEDWLTSL